MSTMVKSKPVVLEVVGESALSAIPSSRRYKGRGKTIGPFRWMGGKQIGRPLNTLLGLTAEQMRAAQYASCE